MARLSMDDVLARVSQLPALPQIVVRILDSLADENIDLERLSETVASDPAVAARLLAAANSGIFGGHHVSSLRQALLLLGVRFVRQITVATALIDRFQTPLPFDAINLWRHSLGVAICAQEIARRGDVCCVDPDVAYIAGLLHDIGQLLLFATDPYGYSEVLGDFSRGSDELVFIERAVLGLDHAQVGGELARRWNLPAPIARAIAHHHALGLSEPDSALSDVVHVAEVLAHALDFDASPMNRVPPLCDLACARLGLNWQAFAPRFPLIEARFDGARLTLGL